jgi:hypothetical protein
MTPKNHLKRATPSLCLIAVVLISFAFAPQMQAVNPPPDGGYPGRNTAEGTNALFNLTTGQGNTAVGDSALISNTTGDGNTANGMHVLFSNPTGNSNTAQGVLALFYNTTGAHNTAVGRAALGINTTGGRNTAIGSYALYVNTSRRFNTATGVDALLGNTNGNVNTAIGFKALSSNTEGDSNTAIGFGAGSNQTTGSGNVYIGAVGVSGVPGENHACYIASIFGRASPSGVPVVINSNNKLGTATSSKRFKEKIKSMDKASEALFALKPVTFRYKKEIDLQGIPQFGLVAEEVDKVNPDLVVRDKEGEPYTVRYDAVNAMLLNEFLKEHRKVEQQEATIAALKSTVAEKQKEFESKQAQQQKQIETLTAGLQKVSAQLEVSKAVPQTAENNQ